MKRLRLRRRRGGSSRSARAHADVIVPQLRGRDDFTLDLGAASFLVTWDP